MATGHGIVILDFGAQYSQLIARRIREHHVHSVIVPYNISTEALRKLAPEGIILSGGPSSVFDEGAPHSDPAILEMGVPVLGICYGLQLIAQQMGGQVRPAPNREYGRALLEIADGSRLLRSLPSPLPVWNSHGDEVVELPRGFRQTGRTESAVAAAEDPQRDIYAVQFHPEVRHTAHGDEILANFIFDICKAAPDWTSQSFIERTIAEVRQTVGAGHALCALSGGVDSTVAATLVHRAIGDRLVCVFVNNGLLRQNEFPTVMASLRRLGLNVTGVDASERFLAKLQDVTDPEQKRRIIGYEFIRVFEEEAARRGQVEYLVQGTLYPDVIESVSVRGPSATIKTHHNVGGLPEVMQMKLIEPLRDLFKDEVRRVGADLGLDPEILHRQPFPGPGLAVRILGEVTPERLELLRAADEIVYEEIRAAALYDSIWQSFAVLLPVRSVGVMGDQRTYGYTAALRAVHSEDAMTADWVRLPYEVMERISSRIVNEVRGITRVVYDITSKPPSTIEWE
ncbi:MAG: glutamine-hydrolyzing GMP synthase [Acidobacteria bacterium RIFCSPLOWO2_12_FULL_60_22]|nr:MAG: glutamine-hydrolyzing GMP synthase [Acidobacteria bacterium RIFCSPLOWO2_12_FULL_60_22]